MGAEDVKTTPPVGGPPAVEGPMVQHTTIIRCASCTHHKSTYWSIEDGNDFDWGFDHLCSLEGREIGANDDTPILATGRPTSRAPAQGDRAPPLAACRLGEVMAPANFDLTTNVAKVHWSLNTSVDCDSLSEDLSEDLIQVVFCSGVIVDVGWYPSFDATGCFRTMVIVDENWDAPVHVAECRNTLDLQIVFADCLARARHALVTDSSSETP